MYSITASPSATMSSALAGRIATRHTPHPLSADIWILATVASQYPSPWWFLHHLGKAASFICELNRSIVNFDVRAVAGWITQLITFVENKVDQRLS
jgi:hypothetical protein